MRLSEAILLGRVLVQKPAAHNLDTCALGMGLKAVGRQARYDFGGLRGVPNLRGLKDEWPWLASPIAAPCCPELPGGGIDAVAHIFDEHVMGLGDWTLEQLVDWVRSVEPADPPQFTGDTIDQLTAAVIRAEKR